MVRKIIYLAVMGCILCSCKEEKTSVKQETIHEVNPIEIKMGVTNGDNLIEKYDFSTYFKKEYIGVFGEKQKAITITFSSIKRSEENSKLYDVKGFSVHQNNQVNFTGEITLDRVLKINEEALHVLFSYELKEEDSTYGNGVFSGNGTAIKNEKGLFNQIDFLGVYNFPNEKSVLCSFK